MKTTAILTPICLLASFANAQSLQLRRDTVIKVTMEQTLRSGRNHAGERFSARVSDDQNLPTGTRMEGQIVDIHRGRGGHDEMELRFNKLLMSNGDSSPISAIPVRMDHVNRDRDGVFRIKNQKVRKENYVLGGLAGGAILGSLLHKTFEGAFVGTLAGIVLAESAQADQDIVLRKGEVIGALITEDVTSGSSRKPDSGGASDDPFGGRIKREGGRTELRVAVGKTDLNFGPDTQPYREDQVVMVPLIETAKQLRLDVESTNEGKATYLSNDDFLSRLETGNKTISMNGQRIQLEQAPTLRGQVLFVPLSLFGTLKLGNPSVNGAPVNSPA